MRKLVDKTRVTAPDSDFPYGRVRNRTSALRGTPVDEELYGDMHQFFEKLFANSGIASNDLPDNEYSGFQLFQAFLAVAGKYNAGPVIKGLLNGYTSGDLIVLFGVEITLSGGNNTATWTEGAIFYKDASNADDKGRVYLVSAGTTTKSGGETFFYSISDDDDSLITVSYGSSGAGLADYGDNTVKPLNSSTSSGFAVSSQANTTGASIQGITARKKGGIISISTRISATVTTGGAASFEVRLSVPDLYKMKISSSTVLLNGTVIVFVAGSVYILGTPIDYTSNDIYVRIISGNLISIYAPSGLALSNGTSISLHINLEGEAL